MYDDYVLTTDGLEQTVEVKWVPIHSWQRICEQNLMAIG